MRIGNEMMNETNNDDKKESAIQYAPVAGVVLVISGLLLLLDQRLQTHWLSMSIPAFISIVLIVFGIVKKRMWWIASGLMVLGLGISLVLICSNILQLTVNDRIGYSLFANSITWLLIFIIIRLVNKRLTWWALLVSSVCIGISFIVLSGRNSLLDFIIYLSLAVGLVFLVWGFSRRNVGLIIPGALLCSIGAGVYYGWSNPETPGGLQKTGIMLVWFALGWGLITVFSRVIDKRFIWWPLIPGGILLTVGSGLYIGGNPENALGFLSNTGSIGLILVGAYLIFLKFGMKS